MNHYKQLLKEKTISGIFIGTGFSLTVLLFGFVYAATTYYTNLPTVSSGSGLTATSWNNLVNYANKAIKQDTEVLTVTGGKVGIGTVNPGATLEVNGDIKVTGGITWAYFGQVFSSVMPNDMSYGAGGFIMGTPTPAMPIGTYFYQVYWCAWQNNFIGWARGSITFSSGGGLATGTSYFDNTNFWWGSCGYFRTGFIQVTVTNSVVQFRISGNDGWSSNVDANPTANSVSADFYRIF